MKKETCARCGGNGFTYKGGIGKELREWRHKCSMGMHDAASLLGVSQPYLSLLERGQRRWTPELLRRVNQMLSPGKTKTNETKTKNRK